jgi:WD40 repeat protein
MKLAALLLALILAAAAAADEIVPEKGLDTGFALAVGLTWSPDGKLVACRSDIGEIGIWRWPSLQLVKTLRGHSAMIRSLSWHPDSNRLASGAHEADVVVWDVATGKQLAKISTPFGFARWRPDGERLAVDVGHGIAIFDGTLENPIRTLGIAKVGTAFEWRPDSKAALSIGEAVEEFRSSEIRIWDVEAGVSTLTLPMDGARILQAIWSPDSRHIATLDRERVVRVLDAKTGKVVQALEPSDPPPLSVTWNPSGERLAGSSRDGSLRIWNAKDGKIRHTAKVRGRWPMPPQWSTDGKWLAGGGSSGRIGFWRVDRREL